MHAPIVSATRHSLYGNALTFSAAALRRYRGSAAVASWPKGHQVTTGMGRDAWGVLHSNPPVHAPLCPHPKLHTTTDPAGAMPSAAAWATGAPGRTRPK